MINKKNFFILIYLKTHSKDTKKKIKGTTLENYFFTLCLLTSDYCLLSSAH